jgi:hypothetical protein
MTSRPMLYPYFDDTAKVLMAEFQRSSQQNADVNLGKNRENFCSNFLEKVLPPRLSVRKGGEIWDSKGNKTGQQDIIVIRDDCPCLHVGSEEIYLAEGVFAAIEVKSNLTTDKFREAASSLQKVQSLSIQPPPPLFCEKIHRPLKIVFSFKGAKFETLFECAKAEAINMEAFDIICILERGLLFRNGLVFGDQPGAPKSSDFLVLYGSAGALGYLYLHMVKFGLGFISGLYDISKYFEPLGNWNKEIDDPNKANIA